MRQIRVIIDFTAVATFLDTNFKYVAMRNYV